MLLNDGPFLTQGHRELGVMFTYQNRSLCKNPLPGSPCSAEKASLGAHGSRCRLRSSCLFVPGSAGGLPDARSSGAACRERQSLSLSDRWRWFRGRGSLGTPVRSECTERWKGMPFRGVPAVKRMERDRPALIYETINNFEYILINTRYVFWLLMPRSTSPGHTITKRISHTRSLTEAILLHQISFI